MSFDGQKVLEMMPYRGINTRQAEQNIPLEFCADAQNVRFSRLDIEQRGGFTGYLMDTGVTPNVPKRPASAAGTGFYSARYNSGTTVTVAAAGTVLAKENAGAWSNVMTGLTSGQNNLFTFVDLNDVTIASNGVDTPFKYSDSVAGATLGGTPPARAKAIMVFNQRVVVGNPSDANRHLVQWSSIGNPDLWTGSLAGSAEPFKKSGREVRALFNFGTDAFVGYDKGIFQMFPTGDSTKPFVFKMKDPGARVMSQVGVAIVPDGSIGFFVGQRGIYKMAAPDYTPRIISRDIDGIWRTLNKTRLRYFSAKVYEQYDEVWFAVSTGSSNTNNLVLVYNYELGSWSKFAINANALGSYEDANGDERMVHVDYSGYPFVNDSGVTDLNSDGTTAAVDAYVTSRAYTLVDGVREGRVSRIYLDITGQAAGSMLEFNHGYDLQGLTFQNTLDQSLGGDQWDASNWDGATWAPEGQKLLYLRGAGQGQRWQWQVRNRQKGVTFRTLSVRAGVVFEGRREAA